MKYLLIILGLLTTGLTSAQDTLTKGFSKEISQSDISDLWTLTSFRADDENPVKRQEPLGFIGGNYQRFYIHFISVIRNHKNTLEYFVYGKTRVKDNICTFQGTIAISDARIYVGSDFPPLKEGFIKGNYAFYEDPDQPGTGILKGTFRTDFYIDKKGEIQYNALDFSADGFSNNQFEGTWTSYKTGDSKICNWGDYRIPNSGNFDAGAGEFSPDDKYLQYGWESYINAWLGSNPDDPETVKARKAENRKWWIENK